MDSKRVLVQRLKFEDNSVLSKAIRYYDFLFSIHGKKLPRKELELFAFTAVRGTITPLSAREEFVKKFNSSKPSIENIKGRLVKKGLLVYVDKKYKINPRYNVDFTKDFVIRLDFKLKDDGTEGQTDTENSEGK